MQIFLGLLAFLLLVMTVVPFLPIAHGIVRVAAFPRLQVLIVAAVLLAGVIVGAAGGLAWRSIEIVLLVICGMQLFQIVQFTPLWRKESASYDPARDKGEAFRVVACNVKMSNRQYDQLSSTIAAADPDIVVFMEIDGKWMEGLRPLLDTYPHVVARPDENSYGMIMASRFELGETSVRCLLTDDVPSIVTMVTLPGGGTFRLYSIHPEPPVPGHGTTGRDGETALVALCVREEAVPAVVTGDLNDVAWSLTTDRFRRISRLLDPRVGRAVFSTFDARYFFMRWPLDHLFHSAEFRFKAMKRLAFVGSDHFPVAFDLVHCATRKSVSNPPEATDNDLRRARELEREAAKRRDRDPIGSDWEK